MGLTGWLFVLTVAALAAGVMAWRDRRRHVRPLRELLEAVRRYEAGDWRAKPDLDERAAPIVFELAAALDTVAHNTLRQLKDLSRQRGDLQALVDSLPDPILLADTRQKIILINAPAAALFGVRRQQALGEKLESIVNEPAVLAIFDRTAGIDPDAVRDDGTPALPLQREVRLSRRGKRLTYQAVATRTAAGGVLVVLRDISTLEGAIRMKTDFVANASHELRTPIAAIKAGFETLRDLTEEQLERLDDPTRRATVRCMAIVDGHLQRLEEMLRDLLDLSRVESTDVRPLLESITAGDVARDLRQTLSPVAKAKSITLDLPAGEAAALTFMSDRRLLMLALKNLVENGIKYTPPGGRVALALGRHDLSDDAAAMHRRLTADPYHEIVATVSDTGIGIAPEHLDRVFERFYQVDAARTGTNSHTGTRGTGLGLSIVKHAIGALGGGVRVDSQLGKGTTFTVTLPQTSAGGREAEPGDPADLVRAS